MHTSEKVLQQNSPEHYGNTPHNGTNSAYGVKSHNNAADGTGKPSS